MVTIETAKSQHFAEVLAWLKAEKDQGRTGFYCNRKVIENSFASGEGLCAITGGKIIGFTIFQMFTDGGELLIIEVEPTARGQGLGSQLLLATVKTLHVRGAKYVDVECTSTEGEALCRLHGFEDYIDDPRNYRNKWDNPLLRLYLSGWRPRPPHLWA